MLNMWVIGYTSILYSIFKIMQENCKNLILQLEDTECPIRKHTLPSGEFYKFPLQLVVKKHTKC